MSAIGICGWLSALENGREVEIPDFADKQAREKFRSYDLAPYPETYEQNPEKWIRPSVYRPNDYSYYEAATKQNFIDSYPEEAKKQGLI